MSLKDVSYLELWQPLCSMERNDLCHFGRSHQKEQFCEIILNLVQWFRRRCRLNISYLELWRPIAQRSQTMCAILVEGTMKNNSVKLF